MCRIFAFHHFCGHVHSTRTLLCPNPTPFISDPPACHSPTPPDPDARVLCPNPPCVNSTSEPHLYPTLCDSCKGNTVIAEWFAKEPGARFSAIMEWREASGRKQEQSENKSISHGMNATGKFLGTNTKQGAEPKLTDRSTQFFNEKHVHDLTTTTQDQQLEETPYLTFFPPSLPLCLDRGRPSSTLDVIKVERSNSDLSEDDGRNMTSSATTMVHIAASSSPPSRPSSSSRCRSTDEMTTRTRSTSRGGNTDTTTTYSPLFPSSSPSLSQSLIGTQNLISRMASLNRDMLQRTSTAGARARVRARANKSQGPKLQAREGVGMEKEVNETEPRCRPRPRPRPRALAAGHDDHGPNRQRSRLPLPSRPAASSEVSLPPV